MLRRIMVGAGLLALLGTGGCGLRGCSREAQGLQPPNGVHHVYECRADGQEHPWTPADIQQAIARNEVGRTPEGEPLFKCPQCGKFELRLVTKGGQETVK